MKPARVTVAGRSLVVTPHALERWHERCRSAMPRDVSNRDLLRVAAAAGTFGGAPEWLPPSGRDSADEFLLLGTDIAFPLRGPIVTTCIVRGAPSAGTLANRAATRAQRTATRARRRAKGSQAGSGNDVYGRRGAGWRKNNRGVTE